MSGPIRVVLVDDQQMVRAGFTMLIDSQPDLQVVGQAGDGIEALALLSSTACDVVLMDVRMPRMDGVEATRAIAAGGAASGGGTGPRVIVLTTFDLDEYAFAAIRAGAAAFLLKDAAPTELLAAIRTVHAGDGVVAPSTTRRLLEHVAASLAPAEPTEPTQHAQPTEPAQPAAHSRLTPLTEREREVLVLVGRGLSNHEIAAELVVAETTVKTHISRLLAKTDSRDRVHLVVLAYESGVLD